MNSYKIWRVDFILYANVFFNVKRWMDWQELRTICLTCTPNILFYLCEKKKSKQSENVFQSGKYFKFEEIHAWVIDVLYRSVCNTNINAISFETCRISKWIVCLYGVTLDIQIFVWFRLLFTVHEQDWGYVHMIFA